MVEFPQKRLTFWETPPLSVKLSFALGGKVSQKVKWRSGKPLPKLLHFVVEFPKKRKLKFLGNVTTKRKNLILHFAVTGLTFWETPPLSVK